MAVLFGIASVWFAKKESIWERILRIFYPRKVVVYRPAPAPPKKVPSERIPPEEEKLPSKKPPVEELGVLRYLPYVTIGLGAILLVIALTSRKGERVIVTRTLPAERRATTETLPAGRRIVTETLPVERI